MEETAQALGVRELIRRGAERDAAAPALLAPGGFRMSYGELLVATDRFAGRLQACGLSPGARIATVAPDGPQAAAAFLAAASFGIAAPLNPGYRESEFAFYLEDAKAEVLVASEEDHRAAEWMRAAAGLGLPVIPPDFDGLGSVEHSTPFCGDDDVALLLHTSGTTGRPKAAPLTHRNLLCSAARIAETLRLEPTDLCLGIMPLFHIHGLAAGLLATLRAGAALICTPGFRAPEFFGWLEEFEPTWYTAAPAMHQAIMARARDHGERVRGGRLRLIRSSSAALPVAVSRELEEVFGAPVLEAYGMTEASHQIACNPLPPAPRKPGTVGLPAGPDVVVLDAEGRAVAQGETGEICIRGESVFNGYLDRPEVNAEAFVAGWFRTGDLGYFDAGGYLTICGRLKEMINRGGEKIAPREIDEVLLQHPAVTQAVAFSVPDARLGEEIAAAVVCSPGVRIEERELRKWVADRLAAFKAPRRVLFLEDIPKGATGKIQRLQLAKQLGIDGVDGAGSMDSREATESRDFPADGEAGLPLMRRLWKEVLRSDAGEQGVGFVEAGGDSVTATQLAARIWEESGVEIPVWELLDRSTMRGMASLLGEGAGIEDRA
ncbi:MAG TPA: non-ribosomal peptide synthetase [Verrucomicrobiales bacterium]|nr:non-ribosomal peptide synthetase [Verrucomicrobiales bacterium]